MQTRQFSLQPALSYKERLEDVAQMELAEVEAAYARELNVLEFLGELQSRGYEEVALRHVPGKLDVEAIGIYFCDIHALERRINQQLLVIDDLAEKTRRKRERLLEVAKEKKALEKLKEKHERKVGQALIQAENKVMADIAIAQYHRRRAG